MKQPLTAAVLRRVVVCGAGASALALTFSACGPTRTAVPPEDLLRLAREQREGWYARLAEDSAELVERVHREYVEYQAGRGPEPIMDVLALSGGGDYGAFGAGFLTGWGQCENPEHRRPRFDAVSGVSTGALIAPFAFLGEDADIAQIDELYRNPRKDWAELRDLFFWMPGRASFMVTDGLRDHVRKVITDDMVSRLVEEDNKGRLLIISATNLDLGDQVVWNLGSEASSHSPAAARERLVDMMMASAAIPAVFPPVEIDGFLYGDGGVTANVLIRLERTNPAGFFVQWHTKYPDLPFPRVRFWVLLNNQRLAPPATAQSDWTDIAGKSISTAIRSATIAQVELLTAKADDVNARHGTRVEVYLTAIPPEWSPPVEGTFKQETMRSLSDLGRARGADPASWILLTEPHVDAPPPRR